MIQKKFIHRNRNERTPCAETEKYKESNTNIHKASISGENIIIESIFIHRIKPLKCFNNFLKVKFSI